MKIIFVVRQLSSGGAERSTIIFGEELAKRGHIIEVWNVGINTPEDLYKWNSWARVKKINKLSLLHFRKRKDELLILVNNVGHRYVRNDYAISILHGDCIDAFRNEKSYFFKIFELLKIKRQFSKRINVTISQALADELSCYTDKKVTYIPNAFDVNEVNHLSELECDVFLPKNFIIHLGRICGVKNQESLLRSYIANSELNRKVDLVFVGGEVKDRGVMLMLRRLANESPVVNKIHFLGDITNPFPILRRAKCLVLNSTSESMGYVLLEAMVLGVPIVATDSQGPKDVLGLKFKGLVSTGQSLTKRVLMALQNPDEFKMYVPERYNVLRVTNMFEDLIERLSCKAVINCGRALKKNNSDTIYSNKFNSGV